MQQIGDLPLTAGGGEQPRHDVELPEQPGEHFQKGAFEPGLRQNPELLLEGEPLLLPLRRLEPEQLIERTAADGGAECVHDPARIVSGGDSLQKGEQLTGFGRMVDGIAAGEYAGDSPEGEGLTDGGGLIPVPHQNREVAMNMLRSKLVEIKEREHLDKIEDIKGVQKEIAWGSQIRSYVFMPYTMVKDHRTNYETGNITAVMDGDLDGFINEYLKKKSQGTLEK